MFLRYLLLIVQIGKPAGQLLSWHGKNLVREFAEPFRKCVDGEEVGSLAAVRQFFSSSTDGAASDRMKFAALAIRFESALCSSVIR